MFILYDIYIFSSEINLFVEFRPRLRPKDFENDIIK